MANWCSNFVSLLGKEENIRSFMKELDELKRISEEQDKGVRPHYAPSDYMYLFDIYCNDFYTEDTFSFESRWVSAWDTIESMCTHHKVGAKVEYHEPGCMIYGLCDIDAINEYGIMDVHNYYLTNEEYLSAKETKTYAYEYNGEYYDCQEDALEAILEEKIKRINQCQEETHQ